MAPRRALLLIGLAALLHAAAYIAHQRPDWASASVWTDQSGYKQLGAALAASGQFTRRPGAVPFVPESIRTPGYPIFLALIFRVFGPANHMAVAVAQAFVFVAICLAVYALARRVLSRQGALLAAALAAAFSPLPYFGALVMTELWATFLLTATLLATARARETGRFGHGVLAGVLAAATALTRPVFVLLTFALFGTMAVADGRRRFRLYTVAVMASILTLAPWFAYNYVNFNRITVSPANGLGRAVWEASWQGVWDGRVQNELTMVADTFDDRTALDAAVTRLAGERGLDPAPMLDYVHQWQDIRRIWTGVTDPREWAFARIAGDSEYFRTGIANARRDPIDHFKRRVARALPVLWIGEIPYRYTAINDLPVSVIRVIWGIQAGLIALAAWGAWAGLRGARWRETLLLSLPFLYITAVHWLLLTEARQSLPGMPAVLVLAAAGLSRLLAITPHEASPAA